MKKQLLIGLAAIIVLIIAGLVWRESHKSCASAEGGCGQASGPQMEGEGGVSEAEAVPGKSTDHTSPDTVKDPVAITPGEQGLPGNRTLAIPAGTAVGSTEQAQAVVNAQAVGAGLNVVSDSSDEYGNSYYQLVQRVEGIPVYGANAVLEVIHGDAESIYGSWQDDIEINTTPSVDAQAALEKAVTDLGGTGEVNITLTNEPELVIYVSTQKVHLGWHVRTFIAPSTEEEVVIVDAHNPQFLLRTAARVH